MNYTAIFELDDTSGWWTVRLSELPGCITQGKTLPITRRRLRDALGLYLNNEKAAEKAVIKASSYSLSVGMFL